MNMRRQAVAKNLPARNLHLVAPRVPKRLTGPEMSGAAPLKVRPAAVQFLAAVPEYENLGDETLIAIARQKTCRRLHVADRWVAIALLLGTKDVLPNHLR
jgi:hypothetical protein